MKTIPTRTKSMGSFYREKEHAFTQGIGDPLFFRKLLMLLSAVPKVPLSPGHKESFPRRNLYLRKWFRSG